MPHRKCSGCFKEFSCRQSLFVHKKKCRGGDNPQSMNSVGTKCLTLAKHLKIRNFKTFRCNELSGRPENQECGIIYLEPNHVVSYYKDGNNRIYFDSLGQSIPTEIKKYLKTEQEFRDDAPVIQSSTIIKPNVEIGYHLYVLDNLSKGIEFQDVIL